MTGTGTGTGPGSGPGPETFSGHRPTYMLVLLKDSSVFLHTLRATDKNLSSDASDAYWPGRSLCAVNLFITCTLLEVLYFAHFHSIKLFVHTIKRATDENTSSDCSETNIFLKYILIWVSNQVKHCISVLIVRGQPHSALASEIMRTILILMFFVCFLSTSHE